MVSSLWLRLFSFAEGRPALRGEEVHMLLLLAGSYIAAGVFAYGITFAYVEAERYTPRSLNHDSALAVAASGWFGLTAALVMTKGAQHGMRFRSAW
jgi:hypothetical protein